MPLATMAVIPVPMGVRVFVSFAISSRKISIPATAVEPSRRFILRIKVTQSLFDRASTYGAVSVKVVQFNPFLYQSLAVGS